MPKAQAAKRRDTLNRNLFAASREAYAAVLAQLDEPPKPDERLRRTMQAPAPWD